MFSTTSRSATWSPDHSPVRSTASPRATQDVDLVAEIGLSQVDALTNSLEGEFYVDANMIRDAIQRHASFNVVHLATMFKADVFIPSDDAWSCEELSRAWDVEFDAPEGKVIVHFASAEDTLLHKLVWYKLGNQVSDRQWSMEFLVEERIDLILDASFLDPLRACADDPEEDVRMGVFNLITNSWFVGLRERPESIARVARLLKDRSHRIVQRLEKHQPRVDPFLGVFVHH